MILVKLKSPYFFCIDGDSEIYNINPQFSLETKLFSETSSISSEILNFYWRHPAFHWRPQACLSSEILDFLQRSQAFYQRSQIFFRHQAFPQRSQIFFRDTKLFIGDQRFLSETSDFHKTPQVFHLGVSKFGD